MLLSLQLYTIRHAAHKDLSNTLQRVAQTGYFAVEVARVPLTSKTLSALIEARDGFGVAPYSFQLKYKQLANIGVTIPFLQRVGCGVAVISVLPLHLLGKNADVLMRFCKDLNKLGEVYLREGIQLAFHHHDFEALRFGETRGFDVMDATLDYDCVKLVCDTYWLQKSGMCPQQFIMQHTGCVAGVHLRDYTVNRLGILRTSVDCPLGDGTLDFSAILLAAREAGASYCAVEQNSAKPFDDIARSMAYLKRGGMYDVYFTSEHESF